MATVTALEWVFLGLLAAAAAGTLALIKWRYDELCDEVERDIGWHRMWTERIMDTTDEDHGTE